MVLSHRSLLTVMVAATATLIATSARAEEPAAGVVRIQSPSGGVVRISDRRGATPFVRHASATIYRAQSPDSVLRRLVSRIVPGSKDVSLADDSCVSKGCGQSQSGCGKCDSGCGKSSGGCGSSACGKGSSGCNRCGNGSVRFCQCGAGGCGNGRCGGGNGLGGCGCGGVDCKCGHGHCWMPFGGYDITYAANPQYFDRRDGRVYSAQGWGVPVAVPLAPNVTHAYNYGWGIPSSRLTPISRPGMGPLKGGYCR